MADRNRETTDKAIRALRARLEQDQKVNFPAALRAVGREIIDYTKATHEYKNITGEGEKSHDFVVVGPGETKQVEIFTQNGFETLSLSSPYNEIHLYLIAKRFYLAIVELKHGFAVLIQGFLKLRREFVQLFGAAFRSRLVR